MRTAAQDYEYIAAEENYMETPALTLVIWHQQVTQYLTETLLSSEEREAVQDTQTRIGDALIMRMNS